MWPFKGILSLLASVRILLSSMTLFIDSIQLASKSPSNKIHFGLLSGSSDKLLKVFDKRPSFHYLEGKLYPYRSLVDTVFGLISVIVIFLPLLSVARPNTFQVHVLPAPGGPITKTQCLIYKSSFN